METRNSFVRIPAPEDDLPGWRDVLDRVARALGLRVHAVRRALGGLTVALVSPSGEPSEAEAAEFGRAAATALGYIGQPRHLEDYMGSLGKHDERYVTVTCRFRHLLAPSRTQAAVVSTLMRAGAPPRGHVTFDREEVIFPIPASTSPEEEERLKRLVHKQLEEMLHDAGAPRMEQNINYGVQQVIRDHGQGVMTVNNGGDPAVLSALAALAEAIGRAQVDATEARRALDVIEKTKTNPTRQNILDLTTVLSGLATVWPVASTLLPALLKALGGS